MFGTTHPSRLAVALAALLLIAPAAGASSVPSGPSAAAPAGLAVLEDAKAGDLRPLQQAMPGFADPGLAALARARLAAARLEDRAARHALASYWALPGRVPAADAQAWSIEADIAFAGGDYARAARATARWLALLDGDDAARAGVAQYHGVAAALADVPAQTVRSRMPREVATRRDRAGLLRVPVSVNGTAREAVFDTGANLSVLSESAARALGVRVLAADANVASGSREQVATRLGVAGRLEVAGIELSNVVFLVIDDALLEMPLPGGYRIDAIVGFPVLRAIGRMRLGKDAFLPLPSREPGSASPGNLHVVGNDLFVDLAVDGDATALHLDTGAPASQLSTRFARSHPGVLAGLARDERHSASAGGSTSQPVAWWPRVPVSVAGATTVLPRLAVAMEDSEDVGTHAFGTLGLDVLDAFGGCVLDLDAMALELE